MLAMIACAPFIPRILDVTEPELVRCVIREIRVIALGSAFVSLLYLLTSYCLVIERIALGLIASAMRDVLLSGTLAVALGRAFGLTGMFVGLAAAPALAYALLLLYIARCYGRKDCPLLLSKNTCRINHPKKGDAHVCNINHRQSVQGVAHDGDAPAGCLAVQQPRAVPKEAQRQVVPDAAFNRRHVCV